MGFTGKLPWQKTPNIDRLYKEGAYFQNAFVTTSLCSPSRVSIVTGAYSHVHTIVDNFAPEPPNNVYFPQYLQKAGYQTAFLGKWHILLIKNLILSELIPLLFTKVIGVA
jgi:N-acetylglucosamine-6-sulfatase